MQQGVAPFVARLDEVDRSHLRQLVHRRREVAQEIAGSGRRLEGVVERRRALGPPLLEGRLEERELRIRPDAGQVGEGEEEPIGRLPAEGEPGREAGEQESATAGFEEIASMHNRRGLYSSTSAVRIACRRS